VAAKGRLHGTPYIAENRVKYIYKTYLSAKKEDEMSKKLVSMVLAGIFLIAFGYLAGTFSISPVSAQ
jgi:hypothetical protein